MRRIAEGICCAFFMLVVCGAIFFILYFAIPSISEKDKIEQYTYIIVNNQQYAIEDLSDLWERRDFIEFTTKDGNRIHATTYELKK